MHVNNLILRALVFLFASRGGWLQKYNKYISTILLGKYKIVLLGFQLSIRYRSVLGRAYFLSNHRESASKRKWKHDICQCLYCYGPNNVKVLNKSSARLWVIIMIFPGVFLHQIYYCQTVRVFKRGCLAVE